MLFDSFLCWKSITSFGAFQPVLVFAGYAAGGLTQPTGTTFPKKVGWDKRSVPNMFFPEAKPFNFPKERIFETDQIDLKRCPSGVGAEPDADPNVFGGFGFGFTMRRTHFFL